MWTSKYHLPLKRRTLSATTDGNTRLSRTTVWIVVKNSEEPAVPLWTFSMKTKPTPLFTKNGTCCSLSIGSYLGHEQWESKSGLWHKCAHRLGRHRSNKIPFVFFICFWGSKINYRIAYWMNVTGNTIKKRGSYMCNPIGHGPDHHVNKKQTTNRIKPLEGQPVICRQKLQIGAEIGNVRISTITL